MRRALFVALALCSASFGQETRRPARKDVAPQEPVVTVKPVAIDVTAPAHPVIEVVVPVEVKPAVCAHTLFRPQDVRLVDLSDSFITPRTGPASLAEYAKTEIAEMKKACDLTTTQERTLRIAVKGVLHRIQQSAEAIQTRQRAARHRDIGRLVMLGAELQVERDRTPEFRSQLRAHRLWIRTVERLLSAEQRQKWKQATGGVPKPNDKPNLSEPE